MDFFTDEAYAACSSCRVWQVEEEARYVGLPTGGAILLNEDTGYPCPVKFKFQINNKYEFHKNILPGLQDL